MGLSKVYSSMLETESWYTYHSKANKNSILSPFPIKHPVKFIIPIKLSNEDGQIIFL